MKTVQAPKAYFIDILLAARGARYRLAELALALLLLSACNGDRSAGGAAHGGRHAGRDWSGIVTRVSDGDTLWVAPQDGGPPRRVRLDGIDAPESCQSGGPAAREALRAKVLRQHVQLTTRALDEYRRELATVRLDGQDVGAWLVAHGHAWSYRYRRDPGPYAVEEQRARRAGTGLFADANARNPREFRQSHGPCQ